MSYEYKPPNKLGYKDTLAPNHPEKIIKGEEFDDEFNDIAYAVQNLRSDVDQIVASEGIYDAPADNELYGRKNKLWTFAAEKVHSHEIGNIDGLDDFVNNHTHPISDVEDLQDQLNTINNALSSITSNLVFGGSYDLENDVVVRSTKEAEGLVEGEPLPADGVVFDTFMILITGGVMKDETLARGDWIVADGTGTWIPIPYSIAQGIDWGNIQNLPDFDALYAPYTHYHPQYLEDASTNGKQYCRKSGSWAEITGIKGDKGDGWTSGSYDAATGRVTFTSDDGLGFITGDLRGKDGSDAPTNDPRISAAQISNWDTAYGWGNHASAGYATQAWVNGKGFATQSWVNGKGYLTSASLNGYATESWVNSKGYLTSASLNGYVKSTDEYTEFTSPDSIIYVDQLRCCRREGGTNQHELSFERISTWAGAQPTILSPKSYGMGLCFQSTQNVNCILPTYKDGEPKDNYVSLGNVNYQFAQGAFGRMWVGRTEVRPTRYCNDWSDQTIDGAKTFVKSIVLEDDKFFISQGDGGWRSLTHGGGWYMIDSSWIRSYGGKSVYVANSGTNAIATAGDVCAYYSDVRLKDVKGQIENPLDKVDAIETFYYTHNDLAKDLGYEGDELQVGVSAQSVKEVMPEVVTRAPVDMDADGGSITGEDYMTVKYDRLVPLLLESIKELRKEVEELKNGRS